MKRYVFMAIAICLAYQSTAQAQRGGGILRDVVREVGGQLIEQQLRGLQQGRRPTPAPPQQGNPPVKAMGGVAMPSEGGGGSGGDQRDFQQDYGYVFPGNGPGVVQPQPRPVFVQPQPRPRVVDGRLIYTDGTTQPYVEPGFSTQPRVNPQPFTTTQPVVTRSVTTVGDLPSSPVMTNQYVIIRCPAEILGSIRYTLSSSQGGYSFTMSGGQEQRFKVNNPWSISYNDGTTQRRYALRGGITYTMKRRADNNWQLYSTKSPGS